MLRKCESFAHLHRGSISTIRAKEKKKHACSRELDLMKWFKLSNFKGNPKKRKNERYLSTTPDFYGIWKFDFQRLMDFTSLQWCPKKQELQLSLTSLPLAKRSRMPFKLRELQLCGKLFGSRLHIMDKMKNQCLIWYIFLVG